MVLGCTKHARFRLSLEGVTDNGKTFFAAGVLAAAVGVYLEISFQQKLKTAERMRQVPGAPSPSASASASTSASVERPKRPPLTR